MKKKNIFLLILNLFSLSCLLLGQQIKSIKVTTRVAKSNFGNYLPGNILWTDENSKWDNYLEIYDKDSNVIERRDYSYFYQYNKNLRRNDTTIYYAFGKFKYLNNRIIEKEYGESENDKGKIDNTTPKPANYI